MFHSTEVASIANDVNTDHHRYENIVVFKDKWSLKNMKSFFTLVIGTHKTRSFIPGGL